MTALHRWSLAGWALSVAFVSVAFLGIDPRDTLPQIGVASADPDTLGETEAAFKIEAAAADFVQQTIGASHINSDGSTTAAVTSGGVAVAVVDMERVSLDFYANTREAVTSISTGFSLGRERDLWVGQFERSGAFNVATGEHDGTAYVVVVLDAAGGKVISASSGVRQPEEQARNSLPLPSYAELFKAPIIEADRSR